MELEQVVLGLTLVADLESERPRPPVVLGDDLATGGDHRLDVREDLLPLLVVGGGVEQHDEVIGRGRLGHERRTTIAGGEPHTSVAYRRHGTRTLRLAALAHPLGQRCPPARAARARGRDRPLAAARTAPAGAARRRSAADRPAGAAAGAHADRGRARGAATPRPATRPAEASPALQPPSPARAEGAPPSRSTTRAAVDRSAAALAVPRVRPGGPVTTRRPPRHRPSCGCPRAARRSSHRDHAP